jgi:hypothetical protein
MAEPRDPREPRIPKETAPFDADNKWTRTWIMYFESLFTLSVKEAVRQTLEVAVTHTDDLTKDLPVFGNDKADVKVGTKSGNTNKLVTNTGTNVTGNTVKWDANGNLIDAGTTPGGGGGGSGTVTSVALTVPAEFSVSGSPVTTSGTLAVSKATQSANTVYAGPTTGSAAAPAFRTVVPADLPLASSSAFGAVKVDGTTITASAGVISAAGGGGGGAYPLTFVQESIYTSGGSNVTSYTVTFPQTLAASGNTAFILLAGDGSSTVGVPAGWTTDINQQQNTYARLILCHKATAGESSAVFTVSAASSFAIYFWEVSGSHTVGASSSNGAANSTATNFPAITVTASSAVFSAVAMVSNAGAQFFPFLPISPWRTFGITAPTGGGRCLMGMIYNFPSIAGSITPPQLNQNQALFTGGGMAFASFSIV